MKQILTAAGCGLAVAVVLAAGGTTAAVPAPSRVRWEVEVFDAFLRARAENKPLVIYFRKDYCASCKGVCKHCVPLERGPLRSAGFQAYADRAVFVWQDEYKDDAKGNVARLREQLKIDGFPTVVILDITPEGLKERGRVKGLFATEEFLRRFQGCWERKPAAAPPTKTTQGPGQPAPLGWKTARRRETAAALPPR